MAYGPGESWIKPTVDLVKGEVMTPRQRLFAVADDANGVGTKLDIRKWTFGACQALEDAARLAEYVAKHMGRCAPDRDQALACYARDRTVRTARVHRTARQWGDLWHCDGLFSEPRATPCSPIAIRMTIATSTGSAAPDGLRRICSNA